MEPVFCKQQQWQQQQQQRERKLSVAWQEMRQIPKGPPSDAPRRVSPGPLTFNQPLMHPPSPKRNGSANTLLLLLLLMLLLWLLAVTLAAAIAVGAEEAPT
jgi:hypothetical protein